MGGGVTKHCSPRQNWNHRRRIQPTIEGGGGGDGKPKGEDFLEKDTSARGLTHGLTELGEGSSLFLECGRLVTRLAKVDVPDPQHAKKRSGKQISRKKEANFKRALLSVFEIQRGKSERKKT